MFGNVIANIQDLNEEESERYQALYCGLCHCIRERYGLKCTALLSYDLTFFILLLNALYESEEQEQENTCLAHPLRQRMLSRSIYTDYAADLSILLAYHKCQDDWFDDRRVMARASTQLLKPSYQKALERRPGQGTAIEQALRDINALEQREEGSLDAAACRFGLLLGELFGYQDDHWRESLRRFGGELGRFVYMMDAAIDFEKDSKSGSYNPFVANDTTREQRELMLKVLIGRAAEQFERLPVIQDENLIRSVLYAGVWQQYLTAHKDSLGSFASRQDEDGEKADGEPGACGLAESRSPDPWGGGEESIDCTPEYPGEQQTQPPIQKTA